MPLPPASLLVLPQAIPPCTDPVDHADAFSEPSAPLFCFLFHLLVSSYRGEFEGSHHDLSPSTRALNFITALSIMGSLQNQ